MSPTHKADQAKADNIPRGPFSSVSTTVLHAQWLLKDSWLVYIFHTTSANQVQKSLDELLLPKSNTTAHQPS